MKSELRERLRIPIEPTIILDKSIAALPFLATPHPSEFGRLARHIGIPMSEIGKITIHLRGQNVFEQHSDLYCGGSFNTETKQITVVVPRDRSRIQQEVFTTTVHELAHLHFDLTHKQEVEADRQAAFRELTFREAFVQLLLATLDGYLGSPDQIIADHHESNNSEKYAWEIEKALEDASDQFQLVTISNKPALLSSIFRRRKSV